MSMGLLAMMLGVFGIPLLLLWVGHRLRRRPARWQGAFWGGLLGHLVAIVVGTWAALSPAARWAPTDALRGGMGFWSWLVLPLAGALVGALLARRPLPRP